MKNILVLLLLNSAFIFSQDIHVPVDTIIKTYHETIIKGKKIKSKDTHKNWNTKEKQRNRSNNKRTTTEQQNNNK